MGCCLQAPLSIGFSRQEYWSGLPFPSPGDLPDPGIKPESPVLQADSLPLSHARETPFNSQIFPDKLPYVKFWLSLPSSQPGLSPPSWLFWEPSLKRRRVTFWLTSWSSQSGFRLHFPDPLSNSFDDARAIWKEPNFYAAAIILRIIWANVCEWLQSQAHNGPNKPLPLLKEIGMPEVRRDNIGISEGHTRMKKPKRKPG